MNLARSKSLIALLLTAATAVIAPAAEKPNIEKLHVVLLADEKDHGPAGNGLHDYPLWQKRWALLLGGEEASDEKQVNLVGPPDKDTDYGEGIPNVEVATAWHWPSEEHFQTADVIVAYCYLEWTDERLAMDFDPGMPLTHSPIIVCSDTGFRVENLLAQCNI